MKKRSRILIATLTGLTLLLSGSLCAYYLSVDRSPVPSYERGSPSLPRHVLVATQASSFKARLVTALVDRLERRPVHVKVIDVAGLGDIDEAQWQVIVIVHTWEFGRPPRAASSFVAQLADAGKVIDVTTSGSGREKLPGVDVISSASVIDDVPDLVAQIDAKIEARLAGR